MENENIDSIVNEVLVSKTPIIKRKRGRKKKDVVDVNAVVETVKPIKAVKPTKGKKKEKIRNKAMQEGGWGKIIMSRAKEIYGAGKNGITWRQSVAQAGKEFKQNKNK